MPKIQVLNKQVAELIAAGEVVDRPSSVIKELVENAVDAGATIITVEIRRGGVTFMRVTDNGCGIAPEDVPTAFLRHATSKVVGEDDLNSIATLGFRGEALASISAVAHVELLTRTPGAVAGVRYTCGGAEEPTLEDAGCPEGTTILVRDLFYNTPARMKFLKKDSTEGNSVAGILDKLALSHPEISFRFIRDGKEQLHTPGDGKLSSTIYAVYGREFSSTLIPVHYELGHVKVEGFISAPTSSRPNRSMQNFFINGRYIRSRTAMAALEEAYKGSIMVGKFPACVLHLHLSFGAVDVNVHPAKLEVRFVNERPIFDAVYHGVKSALHAGDKPKVMELKRPPVNPYAPVLERKEQLRMETPPPARKPQTPPPPAAAPLGKPPQRESAPPAREPSFLLRDSEAPRREHRGFSSFLENVLDSEPQPEPVTPAPAPQPVEKKPQESQPTVPVQEQLPLPVEEQPPVERPQPLRKEFHSRVIGEAFGTYLLVEYSADELMFIDKHAAHERMNFDKLKAAGYTPMVQLLLTPVVFTPAPEEYAALLEHTDELERFGFSCEDFGGGAVVVRQCPDYVDAGEVEATLLELAGDLLSARRTDPDGVRDHLLATMACKAAIKGGQKNGPAELERVAEAVMSGKVKYCPHGRPVAIELTKAQLEKLFKRA